MKNEIAGLDAIDRTLLRLLQDDGRRTTLELAERVGLSPTGTSQRVKRLFREGYVKAVRAILDPKKIGRGTVVFIQVRLDHTARISSSASPRRLQRRRKFWNATW